MRTNNDKMLGDKGVRCSYGCCRAYHNGKGKRGERRFIKRGERQKLRKEFSEWVASQDAA